jgi:cytochrome c peroxidase
MIARQARVFRSRWSSCSFLLAAGLGAVVASLGACDARRPLVQGGLSRDEASRRADRLRALGRRMFFDASLSASSRLSCASCHLPDRAFGPPNGLAVQAGGASLGRPGLRAVPTLRYLQAVPPFTRHLFATSDEGDESIDQGPSGGLTWDGRVDRGRDQAQIPLLSAIEMANASATAVADRVLAAPYAGEASRLATEAGEGVFATALEALEAYEEDPVVFSPYSSRYDAVLRGDAKLSTQEQRGLDVFNDPKRGNCASCHPSQPDRRGIPPAFSDYGFVALGVPRNPAIPANADPQHFDLGLCGPLRTSFQGQAEYCGRFRTPTLRNVATRSTFFHNGVVRTLRDVVLFYATRDSEPARWYGRRPDGALRRFDDLPAEYRRNIEVGAPFGQRPGGRSSLTDDEIDAIVAFLETLTDADVLNVRARLSRR